MRLLTLPALTILTGGLMLAADSASVTYIDGNIADLTPNTGATLSVNNPKVMELETPLHKVTVPYSQISKAELGSVMTHTPEAQPMYKVWALPKRLMKSETRQMTVNYTAENGQEQTMTVEMSNAVATAVLATIERHSTKVADNTWWGDGVWKTTRNRDQWGGAGTVALK